MTQTTPDLPPIGRVFNGANIPPELKAMRRWAVWKAIWNDSRQKYDKIPFDARHYGLSTKKVADWGDYESAAATLALNPTRYAGLGFVLTGVKDVVGIDLDNCRQDNGQIAPWAREIIESMGSYTEISPSGHGLRILAHGSFETDWNNHEVGIEVYSGHSPRFLTITGDTKRVRPMVQAQPAVLQALFTSLRKSNIPAANVIALEMPELIPDVLLPDIDALDISPMAREFLLHGPEAASDRSGTLHMCGVQLYSAGLDDATVLSILACNDHAFDVALAHRNQDPDRALQYLWVEHCQKARPKATTRAGMLAGFDDISQSPELLQADKSVREVTAAREERFRLKDTTEFIVRQKSSWIVKGLIPNASLGVIYGASGSGKSFFVLDLMAAVARAVAWRDLKVKGARVCWIAAEGQEDMRKRVQAYCMHQGIPSTELPMEFIDQAPNFLEDVDIKAVIKQMRAKGKFDVVVVDTLAQVMAGGNENSGEDMGKVLAYCREITRLTGAMVILIHHSGKDESRGARGWSGLRAAADFELEIIRADEDRVATVTKMKGGADGDEYGFRLQGIVVGLDDDGDNETTCIITSTDSTRASVAVAAGPSGGNQRVIMEQAVGLIDVAGAGVTFNEIVSVVWPLYPRGDETKRDQRKTNAVRDLKGLISSGFLAQNEAGVVSLPSGKTL
jgi:archaellum biogenesis ATPase FlaH